jgi:hypothetical protein
VRDSSDGILEAQGAPVKLELLHFPQKPVNGELAYLIYR